MEENETSEVEEFVVKDTIAPIPIDLLKEYFSNDKIIFNIDYSESMLKGDKLITYLSNLDIPSKLSGFDKVTVKDKFSLVEDYMNSKLVIQNWELESTVLKILFEALDYEFFAQYIECEDILTKEEIVRFCESNKEVIDKWLIMLASCSIYALTTVEELKELVLAEYETVDDYDYCGVNFVQLFRHELAQQLLTTDRDVYYFEKQFNEPMFKGKNLFAYWLTDQNTMAAITAGISSGDITYDEFSAKIEEGLENVSVV